MGLDYASRARVRLRIIESGVLFASHQTADVELQGYGPRNVLEVFRILEEAVTDARQCSGSERSE